MTQWKNGRASPKLVQSMQVREGSCGNKQTLDHKGLVSHVKLLGPEEPLEGFKHREHVISFEFRQDYSGHNMENGLGENGVWGREAIIQVTDDGDIVRVGAVEMEWRV